MTHMDMRGGGSIIKMSISFLLVLSEKYVIKLWLDEFGYWLSDLRVFCYYSPLVFGIICRDFLVSYKRFGPFFYIAIK